MTAPIATPAPPVSQGLHVSCHVDPRLMYKSDSASPAAPPAALNRSVRPILLVLTFTGDSI